MVRRRLATLRESERHPGVVNRKVYNVLLPPYKIVFFYNKRYLLRRIRENISLQRLILFIAILLFGVKMTAWFFTGSLAVLTDALESIVNIVAGALGLYSLHVASKPKDAGHPYGHGKAELISSAAEAILVIGAGIFILYKSAISFYEPHQLRRLNWGMMLISISAIINYVFGNYCIKQGKKNDSLQLMAAGRHLKTDTYSTVAILLGLGIIYFTGIEWIDSLLAATVAVIIIISGYRILRVSIGGIMDEADERLLQRIVEVLNQHRRENWVDLHNVRFIKYGSTLHCDCHLTVPWYLNVSEAHDEMEALGKLIKKEFGTTVEMFVHTDGCVEQSCAICLKQNCMVRQHPFERRIKWTVENISQDRKHSLEITSP